MNVLLLSMPDSFEHMPVLAVRMPNGALSSLAGNLDSHHQVSVADLILVQDRAGETVERLVRELEPDLVGLSVMTFQRRTALKIVELVKRIRPEARIVMGGYDPSLARDAYTDPSCSVDFIVRGEGEITLRELVRAIEAGTDLGAIPGLSYRDGDAFRHNPDRPVTGLDGGAIAPPRRDARVLDGYTLMGQKVDVIETSRGCTYDCSFCSIIEMRGRNFHTYTFDRVISDIRDARDHGARAIFIVDDNITLNVQRFEALCRAIVEARLERLRYVVQATTSSIADHGETLAPLMRRAGFRYVFLGIENVLDEDLQFLRAQSKNRRREAGRRAGSATLKAVEYLHANGMYIVGGLIVGNPDDTSDSIQQNLDFAYRYVDWPYIQHPTPYPRTPMTQDFRDRNLIVNEREDEYDGTTAVVRTEHVAAEDVEYMRWKAERWIKARHILGTAVTNPWMLVHAPRLIYHTFRGASIGSLLGLEDDRAVFRRYKSLRAAERVEV